MVLPISIVVDTVDCDIVDKLDEDPKEEFDKPNGVATKVVDMFTEVGIKVKDLIGQIHNLKSMTWWGPH